MVYNLVWLAWFLTRVALCHVCLSVTLNSFALLLRLFVVWPVTIVGVRVMVPAWSEGAKKAMQRLRACVSVVAVCSAVLTWILIAGLAAELAPRKDVATKGGSVGCP